MAVPAVICEFFKKCDRRIRELILRNAALWQMALLAAAALLMVWITDFRKSETVLPRGDRLLVADFIDNTQVPELGSRLRQLLNYSLDQSEFCSLYPESKLVDYRQWMLHNPQAPITPNIAWQICRQEHIPAFLVPQVSRLGSAYILRARLVRLTADGIRLRRADTVRAANENELFAAMDEMGKRVRTMLGETFTSRFYSENAFSSFTTAKSEALIPFAQALILDARQDYKSEITFLNEALVLDPHLAAARMQLASCYARLGKTAEALSQITLARADPDNLPPKEKYRVHGLYFALNQQYQEALQSYRNLAAVFPSDRRVHFDMADAFLHLGDFPGAAGELRQAIRIDDTHIDFHLALCMAESMNRDLGAARRAWDHASALAPDNPEVIFTGGFIDLIENNPGIAIKGYQPLAVNAPEPVKSRASFLLAQVQIYQGRFQSALATLQAGIEEDVRRGNFLPEIDKRMARAEVHLLLGDNGDALSECSRALDLHADATRSAALGTLCARMNRVSEARQILHQLEGAPPTSLAHYNAEILRGEILLASGQVDPAIQTLTRAKDSPFGKMPCEPLARALSMSKRWAEAAKEYQAVCDHKAQMLFPPNSSWFMGLWVRALYDYGRCLEQLDRKDEARQIYRNYLWVLDGADSGLQTMDTARTYLKKK
jgi:tetratricopeptide (TPR) repeat protein